MYADRLDEIFGPPHLSKQNNAPAGSKPRESASSYADVKINFDSLFTEGSDENGRQAERNIGQFSPYESEHKFSIDDELFLEDEKPACIRPDGVDHHFSDHFLDDFSSNLNACIPEVNDDEIYTHFESVDAAIGKDGGGANGGAVFDVFERTLNSVLGLPAESVPLPQWPTDESVKCEDEAATAVAAETRAPRPRGWRLLSLAEVQQILHRNFADFLQDMRQHGAEVPGCCDGSLHRDVYYQDWTPESAIAILQQARNETGQRIDEWCSLYRWFRNCLYDSEIATLHGFFELQGDLNYMMSHVEPFTIILLSRAVYDQLTRSMWRLGAAQDYLASLISLVARVDAGRPGANRLVKDEDDFFVPDQQKSDFLSVDLDQSGFAVGRQIVQKRSSKTRESYAQRKMAALTNKLLLELSQLPTCKDFGFWVEESRLQQRLSECYQWHQADVAQELSVWCRALVGASFLLLVNRELKDCAGSETEPSLIVPIFFTQISRIVDVNILVLAAAVDRVARCCAVNGLFTSRPFIEQKVGTKKRIMQLHVDPSSSFGLAIKNYTQQFVLTILASSVTPDQPVKSNKVEFSGLLKDQEFQDWVAAPSERQMCSIKAESTGSDDGQEGPFEDDLFCAVKEDGEDATNDFENIFALSAAPDLPTSEVRKRPRQGGENRSRRLFMQVKRAKIQPYITPTGEIITDESFTDRISTDGGASSKLDKSDSSTNQVDSIAAPTAVALFVRTSQAWKLKHILTQWQIERMSLLVMRFLVLHDYALSSTGGTTTAAPETTHLLFAKLASLDVLDENDSLELPRYIVGAYYYVTLFLGVRTPFSHFSAIFGVKKGTAGRVRKEMLDRITAHLRPLGWHLPSSARDRGRAVVALINDYWPVLEDCLRQTAAGLVAAAPPT